MFTFPNLMHKHKFNVKLKKIMWSKWTILTSSALYYMPCISIEPCSYLQNWWVEKKLQKQHLKKVTQCHSVIFIFNFEHIQHVNLGILFLTLRMLLRTLTKWKKNLMLSLLIQIKSSIQLYSWYRYKNTYTWCKNYGIIINYDRW